MKTTFKEELQKIFGFDEILSDTKYIGRACFGSLGKDVRMKAELIATETSTHYDALRLHIINRKDGEIDATTIRFKELWGIKQANGRMSNIIEPHIWKCDNELTWYGYRPTYEEYQELVREVEEYAEVFREPTFDEDIEMDEEQDEGMSMM